ncbi:MAG: winged helix-turn-helix transcriptional regulator [bacterium]
MATLDLFKPPQEIRELNLLQELEKNPIISQRDLSHKFGMALGVTNACLKRMARRGWIRMMNQDHRKIGYFLTPMGFSEKTKLTFHLISWTVQHYAALKGIIGGRLLEMQNKGVERIVFYGVSDEMEIAYITLQGLNLELVGIVEDDEIFNPRMIFGCKLQPVSRVNELRPDSVLITSLIETGKKKERLKTLFDTENIHISDICI